MIYTHEFLENYRDSLLQNYQRLIEKDRDLYNLTVLPMLSLAKEAIPIGEKIRNNPFELVAYDALQETIYSNVDRLLKERQKMIKSKAEEAKSPTTTPTTTTSPTTTPPTSTTTTEAKPDSVSRYISRSKEQYGKSIAYPKGLSAEEIHNIIVNRLKKINNNVLNVDDVLPDVKDTIQERVDTGRIQKPSVTPTRPTVVKAIKAGDTLSNIPPEYLNKIPESYLPIFQKEVIREIDYNKMSKPDAPLKEQAEHLLTNIRYAILERKKITNIIKDIFPAIKDENTKKILKHNYIILNEQLKELINNEYVLNNKIINNIQYDDITFWDKVGNFFSSMFNTIKPTAETFLLFSSDLALKMPTSGMISPTPGLSKTFQTMSYLQDEEYYEKELKRRDKLSESVSKSNILKRLNEEYITINKKLDNLNTLSEEERKDLINRITHNIALINELAISTEVPLLLKRDIMPLKESEIYIEKFNKLYEKFIEKRQSLLEDLSNVENLSPEVIGILHKSIGNEIEHVSNIYSNVFTTSMLSGVITALIPETLLLSLATKDMGTFSILPGAFKTISRLNKMKSILGGLKGVQYIRNLPLITKETFTYEALRSFIKLGSVLATRSPGVSYALTTGRALVNALNKPLSLFELSKTLIDNYRVYRSINVSAMLEAVQEKVSLSSNLNRIREDYNLFKNTINNSYRELLEDYNKNRSNYNITKDELEKNFRNSLLESYRKEKEKPAYLSINAIQKMFKLTDEDIIGAVINNKDLDQIVSEHTPFSSYDEMLSRQAEVAEELNHMIIFTTEQLGLEKLIYESLVRNNNIKTGVVPLLLKLGYTTLKDFTVKKTQSSLFNSFVIKPFLKEVLLSVPRAATELVQENLQELIQEGISSHLTENIASNGYFYNLFKSIYQIPLDPRIIEDTSATTIGMTLFSGIPLVINSFVAPAVLYNLRKEELKNLIANIDLINNTPLSKIVSLGGEFIELNKKMSLMTDATEIPKDVSDAYDKLDPETKKVLDKTSELGERLTEAAIYGKALAILKANGLDIVLLNKIKRLEYYLNEASKRSPEDESLMDFFDRYQKEDKSGLDINKIQSELTEEQLEDLKSKLGPILLFLSQNAFDETNKMLDKIKEKFNVESKEYVFSIADLVYKMYRKFNKVLEDLEKITDQDIDTDVETIFNNYKIGKISNERAKKLEIAFEAVFDLYSKLTILLPKLEKEIEELKQSQKDSDELMEKEKNLNELKEIKNKFEKFYIDLKNYKKTGDIKHYVKLKAALEELKDVPLKFSDEKEITFGEYVDKLSQKIEKAESNKDVFLKNFIKTLIYYYKLLNIEYKNIYNDFKEINDSYNLVPYLNLVPDEFLNYLNQLGRELAKKKSTLWNKPLEEAHTNVNKIMMILTMYSNIASKFFEKTLDFNELKEGLDYFKDLIKNIVELKDYLKVLRYNLEKLVKIEQIDSAILNEFDNFTAMTLTRFNVYVNLLDKHLQYNISRLLLVKKGEKKNSRKILTYCHDDLKKYILDILDKHEFIDLKEEIDNKTINILKKYKEIKESLKYNLSDFLKPELIDSAEEEFYLSFLSSYDMIGRMSQTVALLYNIFSDRNNWFTIFDATESIFYEKVMQQLKITESLLKASYTTQIKKKKIIKKILNYIKEELFSKKSTVKTKEEKPPAEKETEKAEEVSEVSKETEETQRKEEERPEEKPEETTETKATKVEEEKKEEKVTKPIKIADKLKAAEKEKLEAALIDYIEKEFGFSRTRFNTDTIIDDYLKLKHTKNVGLAIPIMSFFIYYYMLTKGKIKIDDLEKTQTEEEFAHMLKKLVEESLVEKNKVPEFLIDLRDKKQYYVLFVALHYVYLISSDRLKREVIVKEIVEDIMQFLKYISKIDLNKPELAEYHIKTLNFELFEDYLQHFNIDFLKRWLEKLEELSKKKRVALQKTIEIEQKEPQKTIQEKPQPIVTKKPSETERPQKKEEKTFTQKPETKKVEEKQKISKKEEQKEILKKKEEPIRKIEKKETPVKKEEKKEKEKEKQIEAIYDVDKLLDDLTNLADIFMETEREKENKKIVEGITEIKDFTSDLRLKHEEVKKKDDDIKCD